MGTLTEAGAGMAKAASAMDARILNRQAKRMISGIWVKGCQTLSDAPFDGY